MAIPFLNNIDLNKNQILNFVKQLLSSDPSSPTEGQSYHNTTQHTQRFYNGTAWIELGRLDQITKPAADVDINSHKITNLADPGAAQDAATQNYVLGRKITDLTAPTADFSMNSHKITSVTDPTNAQDAATKNYVDSQVGGARDVKESCRLATNAALAAYTRATNVITANANGAMANIDGVAPAVNDRILLKNGAAAADNGIYTVTSLGDAGSQWVLTRASDNNTTALMSPGAFTWIEEGTANADTGWLLTTDGPITLNTTGITWTQVSALGQITAGSGLTKTGSQLDVGAGTGISVGADTVGIDTTVVPRYSSGDCSNAASQDYAHNLNNQWCLVQVISKASPYSEAFPEIRRKDANTVTIVFATAPASGDYRITCVG